MFILASGEDQLVQIENGKTNCDAWKQLRANSAKPTTAKQMGLYERLLPTLIRDGEDEDKHLK